MIYKLSSIVNISSSIFNGFYYSLNYEFRLDLMSKTQILVDQVLNLISFEIKRGFYE